MKKEIEQALAKAGLKIELLEQYEYETGGLQRWDEDGKVIFLLEIKNPYNSEWEFDHMAMDDIKEALNEYGIDGEVFNYSEDEYPGLEGTENCFIIEIEKEAL